MAIKVGMVSLGCPKNQMDAELMLAKLEAAGYEITADSGLADVVIVNTCGFIADAKQESIENILEFGKLKEEGRIKKILVTGCLAQRYQQELADELPECDAVLGLGANGDIAAAVEQALAGERPVRFPPREQWPLDGERLQTTPHFFAYMRIADGCDNRCAYCAIPMIRGSQRSRKLETLVGEAKTLAANGVKELVLVAQDTTVYGRDLYGKPRLPELLQALCGIEGLEWIRVLYCYPEHVTDELLTVMRQEPKIVKYMDLPIQHCSGRVLKAMHRPGDRETLTAIVRRIREAVPGIVLRTTVMTGFPGETKEDFRELCEFIKEMRFERLGCFAFSPEEGTEAATLPAQVSEKLRCRRRDIIMEEQGRISDRYNESLIGTEKTVLVESFDKYAECWFGRSEADAPDIDGKVFLTLPDGDKRPTRLHPGELVRVKITDMLDWDLIGEVIA